MPGVHHYNLVSDPGMHNYKDTLVSVLWCWEISEAMHCPWQHLLPGKVLSHNDTEHLDPDLQRYNARAKLERVASMRQIQGYSNQMRVMSKHYGAAIPGEPEPEPPVTLGRSFQLPDNFHVRPVNANEARKTERGPVDGEDVSFIVNKDTGVKTPILPPEQIKVRLLTVQLDQGSPGCSSAAFCMFFLGLMMMAKFDWIHRLIRDVKAAENSCMKIWVKVKLWTAYLWSINKRPFGKGGNATTKHRWMELFESSFDIHSPLFLKYVAKIGRCWNMPWGTVKEKWEIFNEVLQLPSFDKHMSLPKLANWFAWNKCAHEQLFEFWAGKMVYESQLLNDTDPDDCGSFAIGAGVDPRSELNAILRNGGGLRLGYRLMKESLYDYACIMKIVENACWDYYTKRIENVKSPADNLKRTWADSRGWAAEPHIWATLQESLHDSDNLDFMQIPFGPSDKATKTLHLSWTLVGVRMWTMSKCSGPPDCWSSIVEPGNDALNRAVEERMATHHTNILSLEAAVHRVRAAKELWDACLFLSMKPVRLVLEYFRRDKYKASSPLGRHLLMGLIALLADNKIAEDIHQGLRLAGKEGSNPKMSSQRVQEVINHSDVIESRGISHRAAVPKETLTSTS